MIERETTPPLNRDLLLEQIAQLSLERTITKFNDFLKSKGLEQEFLDFENKRPLTDTIRQLMGHEIKLEAGNAN